MTIGRIPRISVIIPSYFQAAFLEETILSIIQQGYPDLELIIIDGGSTDGSVEIIKRHSDKIAYWISEKDNGQSEAINKGFAKSTGEIITWLCSDDTYLPGTLYRFAELYLQYPDSGLVHGKSILFGRDPKEVVKGAEGDDLPLQYFACIPFPQPGSFFTRKALDSIGKVDESLNFAMDYDFFARIALQFKVVSTDDVFSRYRLHPASKSMGHLEKFSAEWTKVFSRFLNSVEVPPDLGTMLLKHGFWNQNEKPFQHSRIFSGSEILRITCHFLYNQLIIHYELTNRKEGLRLIRLIQEIDPDFYGKLKLGRLAFRLSYIPGPIIRKLRKFTR